MKDQDGRISFGAGFGEDVGALTGTPSIFRLCMDLVICGKFMRDIDGCWRLDGLLAEPPVEWRIKSARHPESSP